MHEGFERVISRQFSTLECKASHWTIHVEIICGDITCALGEEGTVPPAMPTDSYTQKNEGSGCFSLTDTHEELASQC